MIVPLIWLVIAAFAIATMFRPLRWALTLAVIYLAWCIYSAHAEPKSPAPDPYDGLAEIRDRIVLDFEQMKVSSAAFFCRFRSLDWATERNNILSRDAVMAAQHNGLASSIEFDEMRLYNAWYSAAGTYGVPVSDCIEIRNSAVLRVLDELPGATVPR